MKALIGLAAIAGLVGAAAACPADPAGGRGIDGEGGLRVVWSVIGPQDIAVGENFSLDVRACPQDTELIGLDATMPAHRHGMNYRPSIEPIGPGRWRIQGMLWHMRGCWELAFELRQGGRIQTLRQAVELQ